MGIAVAVINHRLPLDAFLGHGQGDADNTIAPARGSHGGDLDRVERLACVSVGDSGQMSQRLGLGGDAEVTETAFGVQKSPLEQIQEVGLVQRSEFKYLRSGDQRGVDEEEGIVCRRPDELDRSTLHIGQEHILLSAVEAVDFVDEEQGGFAGVAKTMIGSL